MEVKADSRKYYEIECDALERCAFNVTAAGRLLGTSRETLRYRVNKYGLKTLD